MITRIELENGIDRFPPESARRRHLLGVFLEHTQVEMFVQADIDAYGHIVRQLGHNRQQTLDRLIAAQAITRDATLITRNGKDFRRIDGLRLIEWETPA